MLAYIIVARNDFQIMSNIRLQNSDLVWHPSFQFTSKEHFGRLTGGNWQK